MFTGIVEAMGRVVAKGSHSIELACPLEGLRAGDSLLVNGVCLTISRTDVGWCAADLSEETLSRSSLGLLEEGDVVNLERPVEAGGRLGGHIVQGHVDAVGIVRRVERRPGSVEMSFELPDGLLRYVVEKGSIAVDGVSLTVSAVDGGRPSVALIPATLERTTLSSRKPGDRVNIEVDVLAKYVERLLSAGDTAGGTRS